MFLFSFDPKRRICSIEYVSGVHNSTASSVVSDKDEESKFQEVNIH